MCVGISGPHISFEEVADAYREAMEARIQAFLYGSSRRCRCGEESRKIPGDFVERLVSDRTFRPGIDFLSELFF